jgi:hypothetical protein
MRCLLFLLATATLALAARADDSAPAPPVTDPVIVQQHYHEVLARPEFRETEETIEDMRWSDWITQWVARLVSRFQDLQYAGQLSTAARVLVFALTALAVIGLLYLLVRLSRRRRDGESDADDTPSPGRTFLSPRQYEERLRQTLENRDWHGAWLAAWLQLLARLENRRLVEADRSRTNREYLAQLRAQSLPPNAVSLLAGMVDDYDRFIYGVRPIDEAGWSGFRERIDAVTLMLGLRESATEKPA